MIEIDSEAVCPVCERFVYNNPRCTCTGQSLRAEIERLRAELERFYPAEDVELFSPHIERACQKPPTLTVWFRDE